MKNKSKKIKIEVSGRHVHLTEAHINKLYGNGYKLNKLRNLSQPAEFAAKEKVLLQNGKVKISTRIIGPARHYSQVEVSRGDAYELGINPPFRMSGDHKNSVGLLLIGPRGKVKLNKGVILAQRHIHANNNEAKKFGFKDGKSVDVEVRGVRALVFKNVKVKINEKYRLVMHIDVDEANAAGIVGKNCVGFITS